MELKHIVVIASVVCLSQAVPLDIRDDETRNLERAMKILEAQSGGPSGGEASNNIGARSIPGSTYVAGRLFGNSIPSAGNFNSDIKNSPEGHERSFQDIGRSETGAWLDGKFGIAGVGNYPKYPGPPNPAVYKKTQDPRRLTEGQNEYAAANFRLHSHADRPSNADRKEDDNNNKFSKSAYNPSYGLNVAM
ncbi:uncharacterized protein LOC142318746 isoform X3 [Lycorma delicatula]|uniref:uncharacterized protein LOC142318746 isoform X3 n=1 Tax=Lycorma delicatula TaxID=130591 RepID=UPI003F512D09